MNEIEKLKTKLKRDILEFFIQDTLEYKTDKDLVSRLMKIWNFNQVTDIFEFYEKEPSMKNYLIMLILHRMY